MRGAVNPLPNVMYSWLKFNVGSRYVIRRSLQADDAYDNPMTFILQHIH